MPSKLKGLLTVMCIFFLLSHSFEGCVLKLCGVTIQGAVIFPVMSVLLEFYSLDVGIHTIHL